MKIKILNQKYVFKEMWLLKKSILKAVFDIGKIWNFTLIGLSYLFKLNKPLGLPILLMIEPSSRCNLKCPMCPRSTQKIKRKEGEIEFSNYKKLIDEVGNKLIFIAFWNYGEPLINKNICKMIVYAKKKKIITVMSTNGTMLHKGLIKNLVASGLDYIIFSFDGATKKTYEKYRVGSKFEKVLENIEELRKEKIKHRKNLPLINLQFVVMKENEQEIPLMKKLAKKLKIDKLSFKKVFVNDESQAKKFLPGDNKYLLEFYKGKEDNKSCSRGWLNSVVNWDGEVVPCCVDTLSEHSFGNAFKKGFKNIWRNKKYNDFRNVLKTDINKIHICRHCSAKNFTGDLFV